ncbi:putative hydrocarbon oxygenase MocD [Paraburkholderia caribensis MBA4]|uniref:Putative hydrocarbon oxygenase MocD n=1 Tax=Paraburkholderia caribensis MBA4 TaxID=1323664 RepID=A0A0N7JUZ7_9BURK|nr:fatty acid desaturase [Paraburkholderia caribensis]ALL67805.1 putative hydrocarbon oxygenase MocD [Paraburkholderia caribensis MBA4]
MNIDMHAWHRVDIDRKMLKDFSTRSDARGLAQAGGFFVLVVATGALAWASLGTAWVIPAFLLYGTVFAFSEAAAHELGHGTVFKTRWLNEAVYWVICFMSWREQVYSRWLHAKHHTYTHLTAAPYKDPELAFKHRPHSYVKLMTDFVRVSHGVQFLGAILLHSFGIITKGAKEVVPEAEYKKMCDNSRVLLACYVAVFVWAVLAHSWLPIVFLFLPRAYGTWLHELCALTQHTGLKENVLDHRVSSRTVKLNLVVRLLYWNMNYHIEHHMFPSVPFHALPKFHEAVAAQMPQPYAGLWPAWREILVIFARQRRDPGYVVVRELPVGKRGNAVA